MNIASELITLEAGINYEPTFVSTDKRVGSSERTSLGYSQIGELQQYGFAKGPIFRLEIVDIDSSHDSKYIKVWGIDNKDDDAPVYSVKYLTKTKSTIDVYLKKFIFCESDGTPTTDPANYTIVGHKKRSMSSPF